MGNEKIYVWKQRRMASYKKGFNIIFLSFFHLRSRTSSRGHARWDHGLCGRGQDMLIIKHTLIIKELAKVKSATAIPSTA